MADKESKQLLTISRTDDNVNIEVNQDNLHDLKDLARMVSENPGLRDNLADMFRSIVGFDITDTPEDAPTYADESGSVFLQIDGEHSDKKDHFTTGIELLSGAIATLATEALNDGMSEASVMKKLIDHFAAALTNSIPSVQVKAIGTSPDEVPMDSNNSSNKGGSHFLS